jgi:hypothetical protein
MRPVGLPWGYRRVRTRLCCDLWCAVREGPARPSCVWLACGYVPCSVSGISNRFASVIQQIHSYPKQVRPTRRVPRSTGTIRGRRQGWLLTGRSCEPAQGCCGGSNGPRCCINLPPSTGRRKWRKRFCFSRARSACASGVRVRGAGGVPPRRRAPGGRSPVSPGARRSRPCPLPGSPAPPRPSPRAPMASGEPAIWL